MSYLMFILLLLSLLCLLKVLIGPTIWDRILGFNLFSAIFILIILLYTVIEDQSYLIDVALVYALLGFISIVFITRFLQKKGDI
ncbi:monovalent cation/H+ antiporter complex subunit F [Petrocella sp. FN5]|uniref:monovalent cation/H+ antiporter complex subunit F n=1 Tax=Petrocella sp. FN5 TaxID=3032002 RepID=UPI0023DCD621|nr:monovalent cation/H+ antiporter complex subunit F [Petrocella sp. FN5]MDF1618353.1 monovalent cation/H+ antiporter complex subunit F [Petrocella sp. FN5]